MEDHKQGGQKPVGRIVEDRFNAFIGKGLTILLAIVVAVAGMAYKDIITRQSQIEDKVSFLYQDKVSRAEFREEMTQLRVQNDATKSEMLAQMRIANGDIISRMDSQKADILSRLDFLIPQFVNRK